MSEKEAANVITGENYLEFATKKLGLAEEAPIEAVVEETPAEPVEEAKDQSEQPVEETEKEVEKETEAKEEKKPNPKLEKRFSELTKQREEARKEAQREREAREVIENRLKELEGAANPQPTKSEEKPQPSQFNDAFEYAEALAEWSAEQAIKNRDMQEQQRKAQEQQQKVVESWQQRLEAVKADLPDYEEMISSAADVAVSDVIRDALLESEQGPRILYHLAENPELAEKLNSVSPITALREIGKLEVKFESNNTKETQKTETETKPSIARSKAPAPINPIKTSSAVAEVGINSDGEFHGTYQQWRESRKAGKIR